MLRKKYEKRVTQINKEFQLVALIDAMNMHPGSTLIWWVVFDPCDQIDRKDQNCEERYFCFIKLRK